MITKKILSAVGKDVGKAALEKAFPMATQVGQFAGYKPSKLGQGLQLASGAKASAQHARETRNMQKKASNRFRRQQNRNVINNKRNAFLNENRELKERLKNTANVVSKLKEKLNANRDEINKLKSEAKSVNEAVKASMDRFKAEQKVKGRQDLMNAGAKGAITVGAGLAVAGGVYGARKLYSKMKADAVWKELQRLHPEVTRTQKDRDNFETLKQYAPKLAANKDVAYSYLLRMQNTGLIPHEFIQDLVRVNNDANRGSIGEFASEFGPKNIIR